jgi:hypothetical protein
VFPEGRRVITPDPDPTDYPPVVSHVLESYEGEHLWRDVIDPLLTDAERRDAHRSGASDWFVHAGVRYHLEIRRPEWSKTAYSEWRWTDKWYGAITRGAVVEATFSDWSEAAVEEKAVAWCARHGVHPGTDGVPGGLEGIANAARDAGLQIHVGRSAQLAVGPASAPSEITGPTRG